MKKIFIVTDSTSDLPEELLNKYNIGIAPLYIHSQNKEYRDKIDITNDRIYKLLESNVDVKTSAPSPKDFIALYSSIIEKDNPDIIYSIHLSAKLSNTFDSANLARQRFPDKVIEVFDSKTVSLALGLIVLGAAMEIKRLETENKIEPDKIKDFIRYLIDNAVFMATVENFEYLLKGGRITGLKKLLNYMLKIKPVFSTDDGKVKVFKISRTKKGAVNIILHELKNTFTGKGKIRIGIFYGNELESALNIKQQISEIPDLDIEEIIFSEITPVIGTHSGPTVIGLAAIPAR